MCIYIYIRHVSKYAKLAEEPWSWSNSPTGMCIQVKRYVLLSQPSKLRYRQEGKQRRFSRLWAVLPLCYVKICKTTPQVWALGAVDPGNFSAMSKRPKYLLTTLIILIQLSSVEDSAKSAHQPDGCTRPFFLECTCQMSGFGKIPRNCPAGADAGVEHGTWGGGVGGPFVDLVHLVHREFELSYCMLCLVEKTMYIAYGNIISMIPRI